MRLGLQFYGIRLTFTDVKKQILAYIKSAASVPESKFLDLFNSIVPPQYKDNPKSYCKFKSKSREWATYLEIYACCLHLKINILTYTVNENAFISSQQTITDMVDLNYQSNFRIHLGHVFSANHSACVTGDKLNHFVFLRPPVLTLQIHTEKTSEKLNENCTALWNQFTQ